MGSSISLGKIFGVPVRLHFTWFIIFILVTLSLALSVFPSTYHSWSRTQYWLVAIITSVLFFASVLAHELAHSVISMANGIPVKSITLFILGGVSQITKEATRARDELIMAAGGPLSSLVIGGIFAALYFFTRHVNQQVAALSFWLMYINIALAVFNLIPGFPLDGGRVFRSVVWGVTGNYQRSTRIASITGQVIAYMFIAGGIVWAFTGNWLNGIWLAFIGWFLDNAASSSYRQTVLRESLKGFTARDVMTQDCATVPPNMSMQQLVDEHVLRTGQRCFLVNDEGNLHGIVTLHNIRRVSKQDWPLTTVGKAMTPAQQMEVARPDEDAASIMDRMVEADINQMPVVSEGKVIGLIARDNLLRFIRTRSDLGRSG